MPFAGPHTFEAGVDGQARAEGGRGPWRRQSRAGACAENTSCRCATEKVLAWRASSTWKASTTSEVVVETDAGVLFVRGEDLHIKELNLETGVLQLTGHVHALEYAGDGLAKKSKGLFGKLFK